MYVHICVQQYLELCFTEVLTKPLKNQKCLMKERAYERVSYMKGLLPFRLHTPLPNMNGKGARASIMGEGGGVQKKVKSLPQTKFQSQEPGLKVRGGEIVVERSKELA